MNTFLRTKAGWISSFALTALLAAPGFANAQNYDASLERGARPDNTPEQRYQTAIREAGGGLKVALAECRMEPSNRKVCESQARQNYKADMAYARNLRRDPDARPTQVEDTNIRTTEVTTFREIPAR